ncbi:glycoside hydrolase family 3 protein [Anaerosporobacter faecicola]|uniref:glycoside hydrolase family 3 protein n=1 Tax=Anaerosporobacter faecicola TaxID=2718714 RepID=UPI001EE5833D|nr:glycoside hydrolase family 3 protein [Anaerosporobacter faecicola]
MDQKYIMEHKIGVPYEGFAEFTRKVGAEGIVLLKNDKNVLPLKNGERVSVFGRAQIDYYRTGTGSGGSVNVLYTCNIVEGLRAKTNLSVNEDLVNVYEEWIKENPFDNGGGAWAAEPPCQKEMPVTEELAKEAAAHSDKAIVVIGRNAGEDKDNHSGEGSYLLKQEEIENLENITKYFDQVIVLLNVSNVINMKWVEDERLKDSIQSILYIWEGGIEGGNAVADVLMGDVTPSGKLTDTIAYALEDYPSHKNYGNEVFNLYEEDVYVGYRYFETFAPDRVQYEFGYGLSYTTFAMSKVSGKIAKAEEVEKSAKERRFCMEGDSYVQIEVTVKNTGAVYSGKESVQVYVEAPQGKLGQPVRKLVTFAKTRCLAPGEEQDVVLTFPMAELASYDDSGVTGHKSCMVLEAGEYSFYVGNSVRACEQVAFQTIQEEMTVCKGMGSLHTEKNAVTVVDTVVVEELEEALSPVREYSRMKPGKRLADGTYELTYETVPTRTYSMKERIEKNLPKTFEQTGNKGIMLQDVASGKATMEDFIAQLTTKELAAIVRGEGMCNIKVTPGTAAAFGGIADTLFMYGIPLGCASDGPSGIRMEGGYKATQVPIGTLLAATWNTELIEEMYVLEGKELLRNEIDTLLGPGMNIRRHPLNGRNFEYFSEDPIITGAFATAQTKGILAGGSTATLKHFACNNQEYYRGFVDAVVSERALREIYLKGFETAVKVGGANSIMSTYNPLNGYWNASNYDLNTTVLRNQWGYRGIVMTDWWAKMNDPIEGGDADSSNTAGMVRAQNDLYMVVSNDGAEINASGDNTEEAVKEGRLTIGELQRCAMNICDYLMRAPVFGRKQEFNMEIPTFEPLKESVQAVEVSQNAIVPIKKNGKAYITVKAGTYVLVGKVRNNNGRVAQSACKLLLNGETVLVLQVNGTDNLWSIIRMTRVNLKDGQYEVSMEGMKDDLDIEHIEFRLAE